MKKILIAVVALVVLVVAGIGVAVATFDINKHRGELQEALSKELGRKVKLGGDINIGMSMKGITVSINDVSLGNPSWASRPNMVSVKLFDLKVGLLPILEHKVDIIGVTLEDADILLESQSETRHNWDMAEQSNKSEPADKKDAKAGEPSAPVAINISSLLIKNTRIGIRGVDHKETVFKVDEVTLGAESGGLGIHFAGSLNDMAIKLSLLTNTDSLMSQAQRPVDIELKFANYFITAKGKIDVGSKKAQFSKYEIASGNTKIAGQLSASWDGVRPELHGTMTSEHLDPADLKMQNANAEDDKEKAAAAAAPNKRMFSDVPLALSGLKAADVNLDVAMATVVAGSVELHNLKSKVQINNGHLFVSPMTMSLGAGTISGQVNLDASSSPARLGNNLAVNDVDISDLIKAGGAEAFLSGKVKAEVNLTSNGNSMHDFASNLNGPITLIGAGGDVISSASSKLAAGIADILAPGTGKSQGMNCLVTRFLAQNGVVKSNGILVDTAAATVAGYGDIDLRSETLNLDFHAKPKLVSIGGLLPSLHVGGGLAKPEVGADAKSLVQNVGNLLTGGALNDTVPDLQTQQGQNACAYTLDHPVAAAAAPSKGGVVQDVAGKAGNLIKGLFGN